ncbi:hypothetical protein ACET3Z_016465 [Daucus carota]
MALLYRIPLSLLSLNTLHDYSTTNPTCNSFKFAQPISYYSNLRPEITSFFQDKLKNGVLKHENLSFLGDKGGILKGGASNKKKRVVWVRSNGGPGFNGGGFKVDSRILGNIALAVGLTYLSATGQLGWILDTILSVSLLVVIIPIVGVGAFIWWAGRDVVQDTCPNCKSEFQTFKSMLGEDAQLCPYCGQPFSVVGNKFVQDPVNFSSQSTPFDQTYDDFSPRSTKGKGSKAIVDIEAEVVDAD